MNVGGYLLGALLAAKGLIRRRTGYRPLRWNATQPAWTGRLLAGLTALVLLWCLVSALNARATVDPVTLRLHERSDFVAWLPHSFDAPSTWFTFWTTLGLAGTFWAARDWLTQLTRRERHLLRQARESTTASSASPTGEIPVCRGPHFLPQRLKRLLGVLCVNGALVALVGIAGTLRPSEYILGLFPHPTRQGGFFGPFWYRNNGAQYLNLLWPVCLALWHAVYLRAADSGHFLRRLSNSPALALVPCLGFMTAAPFVTTSRGGTLISLLVMAACLGVLLPGTWRHGWRWTLPLILVPAGAVGGLLLAWAPLAERFLNEFRVLATGAKAGFEAFTVRCVVTVPPDIGHRPVNLVVLSDSGRAYDLSTNFVMLRLQGTGRLAVRFRLDAPDRVLELTGTNAALAQAERAVELILVQEREQTRVYVDGAPVRLASRAGQGGFAWPERFASRYAWVGRGDGADIVRGRIRTVTILDRALTDEEVAAMAGAGPGASEGSWNLFASDPWQRLTPAPLLNLQWGRLSPTRWIASGFGGRSSFYEDTRRMLAQYPAAFGSGPGTFANLYKVYLGDRNATDTWYVHNDHLETRLTFGWLGAVLVYLLGLAAVAPVLVPGGLRLPRYFTLCLLIALGGALLHARFDFVFQTHALLFLTVLLCSVLSVATLRGTSP